MGNSGNDTEIFKAHNNRVASKNAAYKLLKVLKRRHWSNAGSFFTYYFRGSEELCDINEQQHTWWEICCIFDLYIWYLYISCIYIYTYHVYIYIYISCIYIYIYISIYLSYPRNKSVIGNWKVRVYMHSKIPWDYGLSLM